MIFEQHQKIFPEKKNQKKICEKQNLGEKKFWKVLEKNSYGKKFKIFFFQLQVTIPSAHPVQISSRSDYCITVIMWYHTKKVKETIKSQKKGSGDYCTARTRFF